jgi:hypothetical protein
MQFGKQVLQSLRPFLFVGVKVIFSNFGEPGWAPIISF